MKYWDWVTRFHEGRLRDSHISEESFRSVLFLKSFFEKMGCEGLSQNHPLDNRLKVGMGPNDEWLVQYARKLLTASQLSGFEQVARRFADPREYLAANGEMEVALKLHLEGFDISFSEITSQPTPDLIVNMGSETIRAEVSSLNPPYEEVWIQTLWDRVSTLGFHKQVATGGFVYRVPSPNTLEAVLKRASQVIDEVKDSGKFQKFNEVGIATFYFAPEDLVEQMPPDSRRMFRFSQPRRRPVEELITKKIEKKNDQLGVHKEFGLLFLYSRMTGREAISQLFEQPIDDVEVAIATYPKLLALALTVPHAGIEVASAVKVEDLKKINKNGKLFLECEAGVYQYESSLIWKNLHADRAFPEKIQPALENYSSNLTRLAPLQESFQGFRTMT